MPILTTITQIDHFHQFGWIETTPLFSEKECQKIIASHKEGRDSWRESPFIQRFWTTDSLPSVAAALSKQRHLTLAADEWIPHGSPKSTLLFNFQDLVCGALLQVSTGQMRFFNPKYFPLFEVGDQFLILYGSKTTRYIHTPHDSQNHWLKTFGYAYGDCLTKNPVCRWE